YTNDIYTRLEPGGAIILIQCLAGDSRVLHSDGSWVAIKDTQPGDWVWSLGSDGALHRRAVLGQRCSGVDDTIEIRTDRLSLTVNRRHPFLMVPEDGRARPLLRYEWRQAGDLR